jgi:sigma-B regulation protein RsbU (phosphoserine phosphatase)
MADDPPGTGAPAAEPVRGLSIASFLTDGAVIRLCDTVGALAGVQIVLLDRDGTWLTLDAESEESEEPWTRRPAPDAAVESVIRAQITLDSESLGEFVALVPGGRTPPGDRTDLLVDLTQLLARIAREFCEEADAMRNRIRELGALFRLNSLLVRASDSEDRLLHVAVELALGVLDLDAGSIVLFPEDTDGVPDIDSELGVRTKASINLSDDWLRNSLPLSKGREFDRLVFSGRELAIDDLREDPRVLAPERLAEENLRSFLSAALVHKDQPLGVIRLYGREPRSFSVADRRLIRSIAEQAAVAVAQARLMRIAQRERETERQLTLASAVQRRMQPSTPPTLPPLDVAAKSEPSSVVGGDIYDVFERTNTSGNRAIGLVIGDVVGKGLPAALLMSAVRASLRAHANSPDALDEVIGRANRDMCRDTLPNEFTTLWYGSIDPTTLELTYCSAGHEPPLLIRPVPGEPVTTEHVRPLKTGGLVIGVLPEETYATETVQLEPGDVLVAYTDGLPDARNFDNEKWGMDRLVRAAAEAVDALPGESASVLLDQILWFLRRFTGLRHQVDDETLIVVRVGA